MEAISLVDDVAKLNEKKCIGCGVCAHQCPASAIKLERTGIRNVFCSTGEKIGMRTFICGNRRSLITIKI